MIARAVYAFCYWSARCAAWVYFRHSKSGVHHIPREGGFLLAVNHASFLDPVLVGCVVPRPIHYMARRTLFKKGPANWLLRYALNCVPVDRGSLRRDTYREVVEILQAGRGCLIFPEGTRSKDGNLKPLKAGVIRLALQGGVPVVPCYIHGSGRALGRGSLFPRPAKVHVEFSEPIDFSRDLPAEESLQLLQDRLLQLEAEPGRVPGCTAAEPSESGDGVHRSSVRRPSS